MLRENDLGGSGSGRGARRSIFGDPSEPIYTDPSLFERSRSLRSISLSQTGQNIGHTEEDDDDELNQQQQPRFACANNMKRE